MSTGRAAKWAAQRAGWKLANRGDTHFAADRRLYNQQMKELRKEWMEDDLLRRRAKYVRRRDAALKQAEARAAQLAAAQHSDGAASVRAEKQQARQEELAERARHEAAQEAHRKRLAEMRMARKMGAEADFRRKWLEGVMNDYDVQGDTTVSTSLGHRKRSWLTPENFDKRLQLLLIRHESPVDAWNSAARRLQSEEEQEALVERLGGGRLVQPAPSAVEASGADGATPAALPNSAAERSATPDGGDARPSLRTSSTSDEQSAAPPQTSERHAEYLEELRRRIADLDDKTPSNSGGDDRK